MTEPRGSRVGTGRKLRRPRRPERGPCSPSGSPGASLANAAETFPVFACPRLSSSSESPSKQPSPGLLHRVAMSPPQEMGAESEEVSRGEGGRELTGWSRSALAWGPAPCPFPGKNEGLAGRQFQMGTERGVSAWPPAATREIREGDHAVWRLRVTCPINPGSESPRAPRDAT